MHVEKTLIPFGIRLFGASFHGGYYQIPGLGRAPENPENFREAISHAVKSLQILASQD